MIFDKNKEELFNFSKINKKENMAIKTTKTIFNYFFSLFKFFSYSMGILFFLSFLVVSTEGSDRNDRMLKVRQQIVMQQSIKENHDAKIISETALDIAKIMKSSKNSQEFIDAIKLKYQVGISVTYASPHIVTFSHNLNKLNMSYIASFEDNHLRLLNSSNKIFNEFGNVAKESHFIWTKHSDDLENKNVDNEFLNIKIL